MILDDYYRVKGDEYLQENGLLKYMIYADLKVCEEEARAHRYLKPNDVKAISRLVKEILILKHLQTILAKCQPLVKSGKFENFNIMFRLMDHVDNVAIESMIKDVEDYIVSNGLSDMIACAETITQDCEKYVERLLDLFTKMT